MTAYIVSDIDVSDPQALADYVRLVPPVIERHGGRYLVRRGSIETLEGSWTPQALVIVEFPSAVEARRWYTSPEYQALKAQHFKGATRNLILVEGV